MKGFQFNTEGIEPKYKVFELGSYATRPGAEGTQF
jgi:hypothetical protein